MADYIYLLESRLSQPQQKALQAVREIARAKGLTVFLVGGAVRDLTSGSPVRDLDVALQGNALKLRKDLEKTGAVVSGEMESLQALFLRFPGGVRMEVSSTLSVDFPKPGKPVGKPASILEDLRSRDFTANAMALSLNEGSYGLLMDPLNGVADIENREIRLVSNYGFIEDPARMIRAQRFAARLGWQLEERTQARYETGKAEGYISAMPDFQRGYELEEIVHEDDPLRVLRRLEQEGWMKVLCPAWTSAKVNVAELEKLKEAQAQLQLRGIEADASAAQFPLLTAKLQPKEVVALKKSFPRKGFIEEIEGLEAEGKRFAAELSAKQAGTPSVAWKMLTSARPELVLWVAYSNKNAGLQTKFKDFYTEWPQARQKIPYTLMQEMRITPELPGYDELVEKLFFELMDEKLSTPEEMKAYLEPYSPPAPPPPVNLRRARGLKKEGKGSRARKKAEVDGMPQETDAVEQLAAMSEASGVMAEEAAEENGSEQVKKVREAATVITAKPRRQVPTSKADTQAAAALAKHGTSKAAAPKSAAKSATKKSPAKVAHSAKPSPKKAAPAKPSGKKVPAGKAKAAPKSATTKVKAKVSSKGSSKPAAKKASKPAPKKTSSKPAPKPAKKQAGKSIKAKKR